MRRGAASGTRVLYAPYARDEAGTKPAESHCVPYKPISILFVTFVSSMAVACVGSTDMEALTPEGAESDEDAAAPAEPPVELTAPPPEEESPIKPFVGTYKWSGGLPEQRVLWGKIQGIANSFNFLAEGIVRDRLAAGNVIAKEIRIDADSETLVIYFDDKGTPASLDGSTSAKVKASNGEMMDMSFKVSDTDIVQTFKGNAKGRENRYELVDGKLVVHVRVFASQLPRELTYDLTYDRVVDDAGSEDAP